MQQPLLSADTVDSLSHEMSAVGSAPPTRRAITVVDFEGSRHRIGWYSGTQDSTVASFVRQAVGVTEATQLCLVALNDADKIPVPISAALPNGVEFKASETGRQSWARDAGNGTATIEVERSADNVEDMALAMPDEIQGSSAGSAPRKDSKVFFARLTKFERLSSHLANERTYLAWLRTVFSLMGVCFQFLSVGAGKKWEIMIFSFGSLFVLAVPISWLIGWKRYLRVKEILDMPSERMAPNFNRWGIRHQARFFGFLMFMLAFGYVSRLLMRAESDETLHLSAKTSQNALACMATMAALPRSHVMNAHSVYFNVHSKL